MSLCRGSLRWLCMSRFGESLEGLTGLGVSSYTRVRFILPTGCKVADGKDMWCEVWRKPQASCQEPFPSGAARDVLVYPAPRLSWRLVTVYPSLAQTTIPDSQGIRGSAQTRLFLQTVFMLQTLCVTKPMGTLPKCKFPSVIPGPPWKQPP